MITPDSELVSDLIERSSLGTPGARQLRQRTPEALVEQIIAGSGHSALAEIVQADFGHRPRMRLLTIDGVWSQLLSSWAEPHGLVAEMTWPNDIHPGSVMADDVVIIIGCTLQQIDLGLLQEFIDQAHIVAIRPDHDQLPAYWAQHLLTAGASLIIDASAPASLVLEALEAVWSGTTVKHRLMQWPDPRNRWKLPAREAQALWFKEMLRLPLHETAQRMGNHFQTVRTQLRNAARKRDMYEHGITAERVATGSSSG